MSLTRAPEFYINNITYKLVGDAKMIKKSKYVGWSEFMYIDGARRYWSFVSECSEESMKNYLVKSA